MGQAVPAPGTSGRARRARVKTVVGFLLALSAALHVALLPAAAPAAAAAREDLAPDRRLLQAGELMLGMKLEQAGVLVEQVIAERPGHPAGYFYRALLCSWRTFLEPEGPAQEQCKQQFERALKQARQVAEKTRSRQETRLLGTYYLGAVDGQEAMLALIDHRYLVMVPLARQAWKSVQETLERDPQCYDCYLGSGIYKYVTAMLPAPVRVMAQAYGFESDREGGLRELWTAARQGVQSRDAAAIMLMNIHAVSEMPDSQVLELARELHRRYPDNPLIHWRLGDLLLRMKRHQEAGELYAAVGRRMDQGRRYYRNNMFTVSSIDYRRAYCQRQSGRRREALALYGAILARPEVKPQWIIPAAHLECGEIYLAAGDRAAAREHLQAVLELEEIANSHDRARELLRRIER